MKILLLMLLLLGVLQSNAQVAYQNYLDSTVRWTYEFSTGTLGASYYSFTEYTVKGDTLVNNIWYWNVWARTNSTFNGVNSQYYSPVFGLRETPDKKFYSYLYVDNAETLMNDFNLELGDTLQSDVVHGTFFVDFIDTIAFGTKQRVRYRSMFPCAVVEGIGFTQKDGSFNSRMICFQQQQDLYGGSGACGFTPVFEVQKTSHLSITPNPATDEVRIELPEIWQNQSSATYYTLHNSTGQLQRKGIINTSSSQITLSVADVPSGIYILSIRKGHLLKSTRLVVQH